MNTPHTFPLWRNRRGLAFLILLTLLPATLRAQTKLVKDLDGDGKKDKVYIRDSRIVCELSSQKGGKIVSPEIYTNENTTLSESKRGFVIRTLDIRANSSESEYIYDKQAKKIRLAYSEDENINYMSERTDFLTGEYSAAYSFYDPILDSLFWFSIDTVLMISPIYLDAPNDSVFNAQCASLYDMHLALKVAEIEKTYPQTTNEDSALHEVTYVMDKPRALNIGVYDYSKVKKNPYKIYYDSIADAKFTEMLMQDERLKSSGLFGQYIEQDDGRVDFFMEEEAYEYCPELHYVMLTGGHGFVSAYNLETLEEIFVNPSSYIYSPSGNYRFGTFEYDGMRYYIEVKEGDKYVPYLLFYGAKGEMEGVYWVDDETIHYLKEMEKPDGSKYQIGYSAKFYKVDSASDEN